jgi:hypothetical protein
MVMQVVVDVVRVVVSVGGMGLAVGVAIVVHAGSRPKSQGRLPPHLTTNASRSLCPLKTAACIKRWQKLNRLFLL